MNQKKRVLRQIMVITMILCVMNILIASGFENEKPQDTRGKIVNFRTGVNTSEMIVEFEFLQPDGALVILEMVSGAKNHAGILIRQYDFTVKKDSLSGFYCWARQADDGSLMSTGLPVHLYDPEVLGLERNIRMSAEKNREEAERVRRITDPKNKELNMLNISL